MPFQLEDWAQLLLSFAQSTGMNDLVMTVDELSSGIETRGTGTPSPPNCPSHLYGLASPLRRPSQPLSVPFYSPQGSGAVA